MTGDTNDLTALMDQRLRQLCFSICVHVPISAGHGVMAQCRRQVCASTDATGSTYSNDVGDRDNQPRTRSMATCNSIVTSDRSFRGIK